MMTQWPGSMKCDKGEIPMRKNARKLAIFMVVVSVILAPILAGAQVSFKRIVAFGTSLSEPWPDGSQRRPTKIWTPFLFPTRPIPVEGTISAMAPHGLSSTPGQWGWRAAPSPLSGMWMAWPQTSRWVVPEPGRTASI